MKCQIILFVAVFACVSLSTSKAQPTKVCEPGSQFKQQCNDCRCNEDGTGMLCTKKICFDDEETADGQQKEGNDQDKSKVKREDSSKSEGNAENSENSEDKPDCKSDDKEEEKADDKTTKGEEEQQQQTTDSEDKSKSEDADESCTPGQSYKKDCNECTCPPSGLKSAGVCTLLACEHTSH